MGWFNAWLAEWLLTFEELFDQILVYEELVRAGGIEKSQLGASVHVVHDVLATNDDNNRDEIITTNHGATRMEALHLL